MFAQVPAPGFAAFKHVRWGVDEGAPSPTTDLAQTPDGFLWMRSAGLVRFDGATFERIEWPSDAPWPKLDATAMLVRRNGELWVGLGSQPGVAVYRRGRLIPAGMPYSLGMVKTMAEGADGTMWFASLRFDSPLVRFRRGRWDLVDRPSGVVSTLIALKDNSLWMTLTDSEGQGRIVVLSPDGRRFKTLPDRLSKWPSLALDPSGALWVSDKSGTRILADADGKPPSNPIVIPIADSANSPESVFDHDGRLWRTSQANGISYVAHAPDKRAAKGSGIYSFTVLDGLSSNVAHRPIVDREGSVWISTDSGIDQFRRASATQELIIPPAPVEGLLIAKGSGGSVYIISGGTLFHIAPGADPKLVITFGTPDVVMCAARGGGVWVVQSDRISYVQGRDVKASSSYGWAERPFNCAEDRAGRLWVSLNDEKLVWRDQRGWHRASGTLAQQHPWEIMATRSGDIVFNTQSRVATIRDDKLTVRKSLGRMTMLTTSGDDIFFSDDRGLVRLRNGEARRLDDKRFPWMVFLRAMVQTSSGETWIQAKTGVYRIATVDFDRAFMDRDFAPPYRLFDRQDGLLSAAQSSGFKGPQIVEGGDGRIWFLNQNGAGYFEPKKLRPNAMAPPVAIRSLTADGKSWRDPMHLVLPAGTRAIDIAYSGLSFIVPNRVRFRYQLEGIDTDWIDAGTRRLANYSNLSPGRYRFQVIAANADGVWNRTGATLDFEILPTFFQSTPFKLLCAAALLALLWGAYALRLRAVARHIRLGMMERFEERERIARELHDTLLQGVQSVTLRFQSVVNEMPAQQSARGVLLQALDVADQVIAEGRDRVQDLRSRQHDALVPLLHDLVAQQIFEPGVQIAISERGRRRRLEPLALDEIIRVGGEALANVRRHAGAARIDIEIGYGRSLRLRIADDGVGINPVIAETGRPGHFGLRGMRERARKLRGTLALRPLADHGTELVLTVPGRIVYLPERRGWWARIRRVR